MPRLRLLWIVTPFAMLLGCRSMAHADDVDLTTNAAQRRAIRGRAIDQVESPALAELRRWEEATFRNYVPAAVPAPDWVAGLNLPELPVRWDPRVLSYLSFYKDTPRGHNIMAGWLADQGRFQGLIDRVMERHGMPKDLVCIAMIESSFTPFETSRVGAAGLWQFMPEGGEIYGLHQDYWADERRNPEKSTEAVALYLDDLHARFGSWDLAFAAFNAGYNAVLRSIATYNTNDFWALLEHEAGLPWESSIYVPKALACAVIEHNRERFGFAAVTPSAPYAYQNAEVPPGTALASVAREVGASEKALHELNPELRRGRTPPDRGWSVRLPAGRKLDDAALARLGEEASHWAMYPARAGEPLEEVATLHGVTMAELKRLNGWVDQAEVRPGVGLLVPRLSAERADELAAKLVRERSKSQRIVALPDPGLAAEGRVRVYYRVQSGDTLPEVAKALHVSVERLRAWNAIDEGAALQPKMVLAALVEPGLDRGAVSLLGEAEVRVFKTGSEEMLDAVLRERGKKRIRMTAAEGDTLASIAEANDLSAGSLARVNKIAPTAKLKAGQQLWVYVDAEKWDRMQAEKAAAAAAAKAAAKAEAERREREEAARLAKLKKSKGKSKSKSAPEKAAAGKAGKSPKKPKSASEAPAHHPHST